MYKEINKLASLFKDDAIDFTRRMINIPSISGDEKEMALCFLSELQKIGYDEAFIDHWGNVVGILKGNKPGPNIMFNGHLDQVEVGELTDWEGRDPFSGEIGFSDTYDQMNEKLENTQVIYGRGASDCKGGLAAQVYGGAVLKKMRDNGFEIPGNFIVTAVTMEELGDQVGMLELLEKTFKEREIELDAAVSCETTSLKLHLGHRGRIEIKVTVEGLTAHGSSPHLGINAVNKACKLIDEIDKINLTGPEDKMLGKSTIALTNITCTPGTEGVVPDRCYIQYDRRFNSKETAESCIKDIELIIEKLEADDSDFKASVEIDKVLRKSYTGEERMSLCVKESWAIDKEHAFVQVAKDALEAIGQEVKYGYWGFGTDMSVIFHEMKKPTIGYSPGQEYYISRPIDRVRTDYLEKAVAGNASLFLGMINAPESSFII